MQPNRDTKIVVYIVLTSIVTAFITLIFVYCRDVTSQRKQTAEAVAIEHKLNTPNTTLQSDDFKLKQYGSNQVIITCINGLEFIVYTDHNIVQVFEPKERDAVSIPKRCNS